MSMITLYRSVHPLSLYLFSFPFLSFFCIALALRQLSALHRHVMFITQRNIQHTIHTHTHIHTHIHIILIFIASCFPISFLVFFLLSRFPRLVLVVVRKERLGNCRACLYLASRVVSSRVSWLLYVFSFSFFFRSGFYGSFLLFLLSGLIGDANMVMVIGLWSLCTVA